MPEVEHYVLGAGGHAKVVVATLQTAGHHVVAVFDDDETHHGADVLGVPVVGSISAVAGRPGRAVIGVGENVVRRRIADRLQGQIAWAVAVHPNADVHPNVTLGPGTVVCSGAIIQPGTRLGIHCIVNTGATIDHDCLLGDFVHVAPGSNLAGGVTLGHGVFIGIGASAVPGSRVGAWTTVGAGGVVVRDLPGGVTALGIPAQPFDKD